MWILCSEKTVLGCELQYNKRGVLQKPAQTSATAGLLGHFHSQRAEEPFNLIIHSLADLMSVREIVLQAAALISQFST